MIETISGILVAVLIIIVSRMLFHYFHARLIAATILVAIAFIYIGFSLKANPVGTVIMETGVALIFYFLTIIGYAKHQVLIAYGIILHGLWDVLHYNGLFLKTDIPGYWPMFCSIVDLIDGLYFLYILKGQKSKKLFVEI